MYLQNKEIQNIIVEVSHDIFQELSIADSPEQQNFYKELLEHGYKWYSICDSFGTMIYFHESKWEYISQQQFNELQQGFL